MARVHTAAVLAALLGTAACAHTSERASVTTSGRVEGGAVAVDEPATATQPAPLVGPGPELGLEAPPPRPRLTRTITLGQGNEASTYTEAPRPAAAGQAGPNVVVNNHVLVQQTAPVVGGYGYGYGYRGYARGPGGQVDPRGAWGAGASSRWGSSGFEGPRRTAAPGQTPGVGGNWAPAPSFGPAAMR